jgi:hypothetical protein
MDMEISWDLKIAPRFWPLFVLLTGLIIEGIWPGAYITDMFLNIAWAFSLPTTALRMPEEKGFLGIWRVTLREDLDLWASTID